MKMFAFVSVLLCSALPVRAADLDSVAKDAIGAWHLDFTTPDDERRTPIVIVGRQRDELVAWYVEKGDPETFKDVRIKDDALLLTIVPKERNGEVTVTFEARLKQDGMCQGEAKYTLTKGESGAFDFSGKRIATTEFDEVSKWSLSFVTPDGEQHDATATVLSKDGKTYGWYSSEQYELPAKRITIDGDTAEMEITARVPDGGNVDVTFRGSVNGDTIKGNAEYSLNGDSGSFPFTAKRKS